MACYYLLDRISLQWKYDIIMIHREFIGLIVSVEYPIFSKIIQIN